MNTKGVEYSEELADRICARIAEGESLKSICARDGFPDRRTVYRWFVAHPHFLVMQKTAREEHADAEVERFHEIADEEPERDDKGRVDMGWVQRQRLRLDTRKWTLARMHPKYNERTEVVGAGGDPLIPPFAKARMQDLPFQEQVDIAKRIAVVHRFFLRRR